MQRQQAVLAAIEVAHAIEFRNALERAIESVSPAVVGTAQALRLAARLGHYRRCVMAADVEKRAQHMVAAAHHQHRLAANFRGYVLPGLGDLLSATHHLPSSAKNGFAFQLGDIGVGVPGAGYGMGLGQRSSGIKARDNLFKRTRHILSDRNSKLRRALAEATTCEK